MQTLLQIRVDESIQLESYSVSPPLLTAYCQTWMMVCVIRPATLEGTTSQLNNSRCNRKQSQETVLKKTFYFETNFV